jgi:hypothetical protein
MYFEQLKRQYHLHIDIFSFGFRIPPLTEYYEDKWQYVEDSNKIKRPLLCS